MVLPVVLLASGDRVPSACAGWRCELLLLHMEGVSVLMQGGDTVLSFLTRPSSLRCPLGPLLSHSS